MINIWNNHFYIKESKKQSWKVWNRGGGIGYSRKIVKKNVRQIFEWPLFSIVSSLSPLGRRRSQFNVENGTLYHVGRYFGIFDALDCILLNARPLLRHYPHWVSEGPTFLPCHRSSPHIHSLRVRPHIMAWIRSPQRPATFTWIRHKIVKKGVGWNLSIKV